MGQGFKVIQVVLEVRCDLDLVLIGMGQAQLQGAEQASQIRYHRAHEPKLPQHTLPFLDTNSVTITQLLKDV